MNINKASSVRHFDAEGLFAATACRFCFHSDVGFLESIRVVGAMSNVVRRLVVLRVDDFSLGDDRGTNVAVTVAMAVGGSDVGVALVTVAAMAVAVSGSAVACSEL